MFDLTHLRSQFPALSRTVDGRPAIYFDGPAGTQVPRSVSSAMSDAAEQAASNVGGSFAASSQSEEVVWAARLAGADLLGGGPEEIAFGANMTTITFSVSRALARTWQPGDNIVVTRLDHDANVSPWVQAADGAGVEVRHCRLGDHATLDLEHMGELVDSKTRLVATTACSNAFGSLVDVRAVSEIAHSVDALCYVDAVHLAPHARIDVGSWDADAVVCSAYKFYGPHLGVLWMRAEALEALEPYKVRPAPDNGPGKLETGTPSFTLLAGFTAAVGYLSGLGSGPDRAGCLDDAYERIGAYEAELGERLVGNLPESVSIWGPPTMQGRVPTFAISVAGHKPADVAASLGAQGIFVWAGHFYAVEPMRALGLEGVVRIGLVHINSPKEVDRLLEALRRIT